MKYTKVNIVFIGAYGDWSKKNHLKALYQLRNEGFPVEVKLICENAGIHEEITIQKNPILQNAQILRPIKDSNSLFRKLDQYKNEFDLNLIIIASPPTTHYNYLLWAFKEKINVICDKPIFINSESAISLTRSKNNHKKLDLLSTIYNENNSIKFLCPIRRRKNDAFNSVKQNIKNVFSKYNQGINYMNLTVSGGGVKHPADLLLTGAHGYIDGIGTLSYSSFHYIDLLISYLKVGIGNCKYIRPKLVNLMRVEDQLHSNVHKPLFKLIENKVKKNPILSRSILKAETDFTFMIEILDDERRIIGSILYSYLNSSFTPRLIGSDHDFRNPCIEKNGGRMSHFMFDINQGALQKIALVKSDIAYQQNNIKVIYHRHPFVEGNRFEEFEFNNSYSSSSITPIDLVKNFIKQMCNLMDDNEDSLKNLGFNSFQLTNKLLFHMYEQIASYDRKKMIPESKTLEIDFI